MTGMTRGALAKRCAVNPETIRFYEQQGLIPKAFRNASNYRIYDDETVRRIRFIKIAKGIGFTLKEIKSLLSLRVSPKAKCGDVLERVETRIRLIDEKIQILKGMRSALSDLKSECHGKLPISACPILEALDAKAGQEGGE